MTSPPPQDGRWYPRRRARRAGRRAWPVMSFIVVFAVAAVIVWYRVLSTPESAAETGSCAPAPVRLVPQDVSVRVYNATDRNKLAAGASSTLRTLGFSVIDTANDPTKRTVTGVGEVRYGRQSTTQAKLLAAAVPGARLVRLNRTGTIVDVALGPAFHSVAGPATVKSAGAPLRITATPSGC